MSTPQSLQHVNRLPPHGKGELRLQIALRLLIADLKIGRWFEGDVRMEEWSEINSVADFEDLERDQKPGL